LTDIVTRNLKKWEEWAFRRELERLLHDGPRLITREERRAVRFNEFLAKLESAQEAGGALATVSQMGNHYLSVFLSQEELEKYKEEAQAEARDALAQRRELYRLPGITVMII
jgi:hypothetical protein